MFKMYLVYEEALPQDRNLPYFTIKFNAELEN